jgi:hypothetical protein
MLLILIGNIQLPVLAQFLPVSLQCVSAATTADNSVDELEIRTQMVRGIMDQTIVAVAWNLCTIPPSNNN